VLHSALIATLGFVAATGIPAQHSIRDSHCTGVLHGVVSDLQGKPAKGFYVTTWPLGVDLDILLPEVKTNQIGEYRFDHLCPGTWTVVPSDPSAGFRTMDPEYFELLSANPMKKVKLGRKNSSGDISLQLPPTPARLDLHVSNQVTGAEIGKFDVRIDVPGQKRQFAIEFFFSPNISDRTIEVPPDKKYKLRITTHGFRKWNERVGSSRLPRVQPGALRDLNVRMQPLD
jgi:hypothetical protein